MRTPWLLLAAFSIDVHNLETRRLPDMKHRRMSHGLTLINLALAPGVNNFFVPYAVGGYNDLRENVDMNEMLFFDEDKWINYKNLTSARSHFALTSVTQDAIPQVPTDAPTAEADYQNADYPLLASLTCTNH